MYSVSSAQPAMGGEANLVAMGLDPRWFGRFVIDEQASSQEGRAA